MSSGDPTKKDMEAAVPHLTAQPIKSTSLINRRFGRNNRPWRMPYVGDPEQVAKDMSKAYPYFPGHSDDEDA